MNYIEYIDIEEIGLSIAKLFEEDCRIDYSQIMQEIWENLYFVTDAIEEVIQKELKNSGYLYVPDEQMLFKNVEELLDMMLERVYQCLDSFNIGYYETYSGNDEDGILTIDMVLSGTKDERGKAIDKLNNIKYVSANTHYDCTGDDNAEFCNEKNEDIHIYIDVRDLIEE